MSAQDAAVDLEERCWCYLPADGGAQKGPVAASLLLRLLDRGLLTGATHVWRPGMPAWLPMQAVPPFAAPATFYMQQWYYLDDGEQRGPILTRLLLHKLQEGDLDGLTLVVSAEVPTWQKVGDVPVLREAMAKLAREEEEAEERARRAEEQTAQQVGSAQEFAFVPDEMPGLPPAGAADGSAPQQEEEAAAEGGAEAPSAKSAKAGKAKAAPKARQHNWVYITGLPPDCSEAEVLAHFSRVGLVAINPSTQEPKVKLYMQPTGREGEEVCKGDCSLCYVAPESAAMAVDVLSGGFIRVGCEVTVTRAEWTGAPPGQGGDGGGSEAGGGAGGQQKKSKATAAQLKTAYAATQQALSWTEDDDEGLSKTFASTLKIVVIEGLFRPADFPPDDSPALPAFEAQLDARIAGECQVFGDLDKVTVFSRHPAGVTIVKFATAAAAGKCIAALNGRTVDAPSSSSSSASSSFSASPRLRAHYWDGSTDYTGPKPGSSAAGGKRKREGDGAADGQQQQQHGDDPEEDEDEEEERRIAEFGDWLEREDEELPEEFRLRTE